MGTSLARKIRRIGLEKTTYKETQEQVLTRDEQGKETIGTITKRTPERHRAELTLEELTQKRAVMIQNWRAKRRKRTMRAQ
jgi:hypothetical protein